MTTAREVLPGRCYLVTRRCVQRQYWLRPDQTTTNIVGYCFAVAVARTGVRPLAFTVMSNHYHAVIYDPDGRIPEFLEHFHKLTARVINARWGRWEALWSSEPTSLVELVDEEDVLDKIAYTLVNPVAAGLVDRVEDWPGLTSHRFMDGEPQTFTRPEAFFSRTDSRMPLEAQLRILQSPESAAKETFAQWAERMRDRETKLLSLVRARRIKAGQRGVVGRKKLVTQHPMSAPVNEAAHRKLSPAIACRDPVRRKARLLALKHFRAMYRRGKEDLVAGTRAIFPPGTYRLVRLHVPLTIGVRPLAA